MTDDDLKKRNAAKLGELHPVTRGKIAGVIEDMALKGWRCRIQCAWRSPAAQLAAFEAGTSEKKFGMHNCTDKTGKPESLAADIFKDDDTDDPIGPNGKPIDDDMYHAPLAYFIDLAHFAQKRGLVTGILWGLPSNTRTSLDAAIRNDDTSFKGKRGWDPGHVQEDATTASAKLGWRPKN